MNPTNRENIDIKKSLMLQISIEEEEEEEDDDDDDDDVRIIVKYCTNNQELFKVKS